MPRARQKVDPLLANAAPFLTRRARERAPRIVGFAATLGSAFVVSPTGGVLLFRGAATDLDVNRLARGMADKPPPESELSEVVTMRRAGRCIYAIGVGRGYTLCVVSSSGVAPHAAVDRVARAAHVLRLAFADGIGSGGAAPSGTSGAPALVSAHARQRAR